LGDGRSKRALVEIVPILLAWLVAGVFVAVGCLAQPGPQGGSAGPDDLTGLERAEAVGRQDSWFELVRDVADGSTFRVTMKPAELELGSGARLVLGDSVSGVVRREGEVVRIEFDAPLPTGQARRLGILWSAGITTLELRREQITAVTNRLGKRFTWELIEVPTE
jgi:hypothetical protein